MLLCMVKGFVTKAEAAEELPCAHAEAEVLTADQPSRVPVHPQAKQAQSAVRHHRPCAASRSQTPAPPPAPSRPPLPSQNWGHSCGLCYCLQTLCD